MLITFIFGILFFCLLSIVIWSIRNGIGPMPTSIKVKNRLFEVVPEKIEGKIYDLGSGWGTLVFPIASKFPDHEIIGLENSTIPFLFSSLRLLLSKEKNIRFIRKNFYEFPLNDAGLVLCYLFPKAMEKLKPKLENELKKGTWIICNTFAIPGWKPKFVITVQDLYHTKIYVYQSS